MLNGFSSRKCEGEKKETAHMSCLLSIFLKPTSHSYQPFWLVSNCNWLDLLRFLMLNDSD